MVGTVLLGRTSLRQGPGAGVSALPKTDFPTPRCVTYLGSSEPGVSGTPSR